MKNFINPEINITKLEIDDVITVSNVEGDPNIGGETKEEVG